MGGIIAKIAGAILPSIFGTIDKAVRDKDLAAQLKHDIQIALLNASSQELEQKAKVIVAEAQGKSFLQRNWRPITMLVFVGILANNFILVPYAISFGLEVPMLDIPPGMWGLLTAGTAGYIGGRSLEKIKGVD